MQSVVEAELSTGLVHPCSPICPICSVSAADSAEDDPLKKGGQTMCFINLKVLALMCLAQTLLKRKCTYNTASASVLRHSKSETLSGLMSKKRKHNNF